MDRRPIGVFDSGVGGLTVVHELHRQLPHESLVYVVRGRVKTTVGNEVYVLGPGDVGCHPQGVPHTVEAIEESIVIEIKSPAPDLAQFLGTHKTS